MTAESTERPQFADLRLINVDQLCTLWGVKKSWVYDQVETGRLPAIRLGKQLRFRESDLVGYLTASLG